MLESLTVRCFAGVLDAIKSVSAGISALLATYGYLCLASLVHHAAMAALLANPSVLEAPTEIWANVPATEGITGSLAHAYASNEPTGSTRKGAQLLNVGAWCRCLRRTRLISERVVESRSA